MSDRLFSPSSCVGSLPLQRLSVGIYPHHGNATALNRRELRKCCKMQMLQDEGREA
jgi:hypothetical protein